MKHRFETEAKPTNFHRIFDFYTVTEHPDTFPVLWGELGVVVGVECWALREIIYKIIYETLCLTPGDSLWTILSCDVVT